MWIKHVYMKKAAEAPEWNTIPGYFFGTPPLRISAVVESSRVVRVAQDTGHSCALTQRVEVRRRV